MNPKIESLINKKESEIMPEIHISDEPSLKFASEVIENEKMEDEESIYMLALTLNHPEWENELIEQLKKYKPHVKNPERILQELKNKFTNFSKPDTNNIEIQKWNCNLLEIKKYISDIVKFFNLDRNNIPKNLIIIPSDNILKSKETGSSFHLGDTTLIMSHTENLENVEHEFLHSIINPLTEKYKNLIPEKRIISLASYRLKEEGYGDYALSLLNEELIRTYHIIKKGEKLIDSSKFKELADNLNNDDFSKIIIKSDNKISKRFEKLGINSIDDFKQKIYEYYEYFEKNELRERVYNMYINYIKEKESNSNIKFEEFFSINIPMIFN